MNGRECASPFANFAKKFLTTPAARQPIKKTRKSLARLAGDSPYYVGGGLGEEMTDINLDRQYSPQNLKCA
jgi:hypothetical protein